MENGSDALEFAFPAEFALCFVPQWNQIQKALFVCNEQTLVCNGQTMKSNGLHTLFSQSRAALFETLYVDNLPQIHLRALEKITGLNPSTLHRELKSLLTSGWLIAIQDGNRVLYQANPKHPCLQEIKGLVRKLASWVTAVRQWTQSRDEIQAAWIFGSYARGDLKPDSDIDLLLITNSSLQAILSDLKPLIQPLGHEVNPKLYTPKEFDLARAEKNPFLSRVFSNPTLQLK